jgi:hypothetical protein
MRADRVVHDAFADSCGTPRSIAFADIARRRLRADHVGAPTTDDSRFRDLEAAQLPGRPAVTQMERGGAAESHGSARRRSLNRAKPAIGTFLQNSPLGLLTGK